MFKKLLFLSFFFFSFLSAGFNTPITLTSTNCADNQIVMGPTGYAIAIWDRFIDGTHQNIETSRTTDGGLTWETPVIVTNSNFNSMPKIAFGDGLNAIAVWYCNVGGNVKIQASITTDGGATWQTPQDISAVTVYVSLEIAFNTTGNAIVVWQDSDTFNTRIVTSRTNDSGVTWETPQYISESGKDAVFPKIVFCEGENAICVWTRRDDVSNFYRTQSSKTTNAGSTWETPLTLSADGSHAADSHIAFTGLTNAICVWVFNGTNLQSATTADLGGSWQTPVTASTEANTIFNLQMAEQNGNVIATWREASGLINLIKEATSTDGGNTWNTPITLSSHDSDLSQVAFGSGGYAIIVWEDLGGGPLPYSIQAAQSLDGGVTWQTPVDISSTTTVAATPQIGFKENNAIVCFRGDTASPGLQLVEVTSFFLSPEVTSVSPTSAPQGTSVVISGNYFTGATHVTFGGTPASFAVTDDSHISATAPDHAAGTVDIIITTFGGTSPATPSDQFTYEALPFVFSPFGKQLIINGLFEKDITNQLSWNSIGTASFYRVYDGNHSLLFQGNNLSFFDHEKKSGVTYTYFVSWVSSLGVESTPVMVVLP